MFLSHFKVSNFSIYLGFAIYIHMHTHTHIHAKQTSILTDSFNTFQNKWKTGWLYLLVRP